MMAEEAREAVRSRVTRNPVIANIFLAERINRRHGGALLAPWQLDTMPEDYLDAYLGLLSAERETQRDQKNAARMEKYHEEFRRQYKYR